MSGCGSVHSWFFLRTAWPAAPFQEKVIFWGFLFSHFLLSRAPPRDFSSAEKRLRRRLARESALPVACLLQADEAAELEAKRALCPCMCAKQGCFLLQEPSHHALVDAGGHGATLRLHKDNLITAWPERLILPRPHKETWTGKQPLTTNTAVTATPHSGSVTSCLRGWLIGLLFSILLIC